MRRALTTGLALYLGLGGVLCSPAQVQTPLQWYNGGASQPEDLPSSTSEFHHLFPFHPVVICVPRSRQPKLIQDVVIRATSTTPRSILAHHRPASGSALPGRRVGVQWVSSEETKEGKTEGWIPWNSRIRVRIFFHLPLLPSLLSESLFQNT